MLLSGPLLLFADDSPPKVGDAAPDFELVSVTETKVRLSEVAGKSPVVLIICLAVVLSGVNSALGTFWALPSSFLTGAAAAGGIALINSLGNLGGLIGPTAMGGLKKAYGYEGGFITMGISLIIGAGLVLAFRPKKKA